MRYTEWETKTDESRIFEGDKQGVGHTPVPWTDYRGIYKDKSKHYILRYRVYTIQSSQYIVSALNDVVELFDKHPVDWDTSNLISHGEFVVRFESDNGNEELWDSIRVALKRHYRYHKYDTMGLVVKRGETIEDYLGDPANET